MLDYLLANCCVFSIMVILIYLFNIHIPELYNYYKEHNYKALSLDFIRISIILLITILLFKFIKIGSIILLIILFLLFIGILDVSIYSIIKNINDNNFINEFKNIIGEWGHKIILQDIIILFATLVLSMLFKYFHPYIKILLTLILVGFMIISLTILKK